MDSQWIIFMDHSDYKGYPLVSSQRNLFGKSKDWGLFQQSIEMIRGLGSTIPVMGDLPSGKRLHSYGKSPFSMGKSAINHHFQ